MEMLDIRKDSFAAVEHVGDAMMELAQQAESVLGYGVLKSSSIIVNPVELTPLQATLKGLEIEVLRRSDVLQYMKERELEHTREMFKVWAKEFSAKDKIYNFDSFRGPAWVRTKIKEYKQPIPEFVLAKAVQIKQAIPECEIWVEGLESNPDPFLAVGFPDKDYSWEYPKEIYYIEVWAEPKFEGRMSAEPDDLAF